MPGAGRGVGRGAGRGAGRDAGREVSGRTVGDCRSQKAPILAQY